VGSPGGANFAEIVIQKSLDARIGGAEMPPKQAILVLEVAKKRARQFEKLGLRSALPYRLSQRGELEVEIPGEIEILGGRHKTSPL
jgi:hypothetical protein